MDFNFEYDAKASNGMMNMDYSNLSIKIIDPESRDQNLLHRIKTFVANIFKLKESNRKTEADLREGQISFRRNLSKSEIAFWWKSLLSGIKSSVGLEEPVASI